MTTTNVGDKYNPFDPGFLNNAAEVYQELHTEAPVTWSEAFESWVVTRYDDVVQAVTSTDFSSSGKSGPAPPAEVMEELAKGYPMVEMLYSTDPPRHTRLRTLLGAALSAQLTAAFEPTMRADAEGVIDRFADKGEAELYKKYVKPLTSLAILDYVGVPRSDHDQVLHWQRTWEKLFIPGREPEDLRNSTREVVKYQHYLAGQVEQRRDNPREDLFTSMLSARADDLEPLKMNEIVWGLIEIIGAAGNTTYGMANVILHALHPDNWKQLQADRSLVAQAVEEGMRVESPVLGCARETARDVEIGGVKLPAGAPVLISFAAANLDEGHFHNARNFQLQRDNAARQVTLGRGPHYCVGARLGRLMISVAVEALLDKLPTAHLPEDFQPEFYAPFPFLRCVSALPAQWNTSA